MTDRYRLSCLQFGAALLLAPAGPVLAQSPTITTVIPMANAVTAARTGPLTFTFSQPLTAASAGALKVFSSQRGGLRTRGTTAAVVSGNTLSFVPSAYPFMPGETVQYSVTTAAAGSGGALARARVGQYTTAVDGTGSGSNFQLSSSASIGAGFFPAAIAISDVDNDGDLDLLTANAVDNTLSVRLNNGNGIFSGTQNIPVVSNPYCVAVGDVDGDGDVDAVISNSQSNPGTVSVRLNNGSGSFSDGQDARVSSNPMYVTLGDIDGDGDLDMLAVNPAVNTVSIRLNDGSGIFSGNQSVSVGASPHGVQVADIDGDGDLDLLTPNYTGNTVSVRLNDGRGIFSLGSEVAVGGAPSTVVMGDVDGDNDLDLLTANYYGSTVSVRLNNGTGIFSGNQNIPVGLTGLSAQHITVGDFDGDGDLDLAATNTNDGFVTTSNTISIRFNDGSGIFSGSQEIPVIGSQASAYRIIAGDVDNDGDLDLLVVDFQRSIVNTFLNNSTGLSTAAGRTSSGFTVFPNPAHERATIAGLAPFASCALLDALGRIILTSSADATGTAHLVIPEKLPAGLYIARSESQSCRLVVE